MISLQPVSYSTDNSSVNVSWEGFTDPESGVASYELSLWKNESCLEGSETTLVNDWIKLSSNYSFYQFVDQILEVSLNTHLYKNYHPETFIGFGHFHLM